MSVSRKFLFFCNSFSTGLLAPVLSLVFLTHGASLETLPLFTAVFSISVILMEIPSGIAADLFGRKKAFLISHIFLIMNYGLLVMNSGAEVLAAACVLHGTGKAFASGSLEALTVEEQIRKEGEGAVSEINREILVMECSGLGIRSLAFGSIRVLWTALPVCSLLCMILIMKRYAVK